MSVNILSAIHCMHALAQFQVPDCYGVGITNTLSELGLEDHRRRRLHLLCSVGWRGCV